MSITKPALIKCITKNGKSNSQLSKFEKEFHLFPIVVFSFSTALGMIF